MSRVLQLPAAHQLARVQLLADTFSYEGAALVGRRQHLDDVVGQRLADRSDVPGPQDGANGHIVGRAQHLDGPRLGAAVDVEHHGDGCRGQSQAKKRADGYPARRRKAA